MSPEQKNGFRIALTVFAGVAAFILYYLGGFDSVGVMGVAILISAFAAVAFLLYKYIESDKTDFK